MDVISFGAINLDEMYSVRSLAALPGLAVAPGSERIVDADEYGELTRLLEEAGAGRLVSGGGQAANTLYALARLGFRTAIIGSVGADAEGESLLAGLAPVDTSQVVRGGRTTRCAVIVDKNGERTICVLSSAEEVPVPDPVVAYCTFPIVGGAFEPLWDKMTAKLRSATLEEIRTEEGYGEPLFAAVRAAEFKREVPLLLSTLLMIAGVRTERGSP